ncbi:MAG: 16S rRNA processing protein RimM [Deltaproteobacteria bacterium]|nr:16S rRNA processing protein RimM [Deltaproteobacteria bacterium]MBW2126197.1 16S rRNA processing protein RimM [Deltaproteobacteria bacterium]RLB17436.1 MAG: 16S rRNA processing protein RimM [Deltaproteobacteria bacterium]RLB23273.1 MAG: 16S rRNA processing protein RimM [Deltaproteobacteria bacterium]
MRRISPADLIIIGKVRRPHGLKGLLQVESYAESHESFLQAGTVFLKDASQGLVEYRVVSARPHKRALLVALEGIGSIEDAERFRGSVIMAKKAVFQRSPEGEFFWHELLGLEVYLDSGEYLGKLSQIIPTGANDVYVVKKGEREYLIPATVEVIRQVDLEQGTMTISPLEGMLDTNEI